jgi:hypothetical protein
MEKKLELSAKELAGLDFIIANKQEDADFIGGIAKVAIDVAKVAAAVAQVAAVVGGRVNIQDSNPEQTLIAASNATLQELIDVRNRSIKGS